MQEFQNAINALEEQLQDDRRHGHLKKSQLRAMKEELAKIKEGTIKGNVQQILDAYQALHGLCVYRAKALSKWTLLGAAIFAFVETFILSLMVLASKGMILLPLSAWVAVGGIGALMGHVIARYNAKWKINTVLSKSIEYLNIHGNYEAAAKLKAHLPWTHRLKCTLFSSSSYNPKRLEELEMQKLTPP